jgi:hypothetical protein
MRGGQRKAAKKLDERLESREFLPGEEGKLELGACVGIARRARGDDFGEQLRELFGTGFDQSRLPVVRK